MNDPARAFLAEIAAMQQAAQDSIAECDRQIAHWSGMSDADWQAYLDSMKGGHAAHSRESEVGFYAEQRRKSTERVATIRLHLYTYGIASDLCLRLEQVRFETKRLAEIVGGILDD